MDVHKKTIIFMGSMNAMPMAYALEMRQLGYEVLYFVDAKKNNHLCRPEHHFHEIDYPYPDWIIEIVLPSQMLLPLFPKLFSSLLQKKIRQRTKNKISHFILNGFFVSLSPFLPKNSNKVGLSHGSDLDTWAYSKNTSELAESFSQKSFFKFLPEKVNKFLINHIILTQYKGYLSSNAVCYFPKGFNEQGDQVIGTLEKSGVKHIPRYDISPEMLKYRSNVANNNSPRETLQIFSVVRFLFKTFPDGNKQYNKGNDIIIEGISRYYKINRNIQVHFFEKGEDILLAKKLCKLHNIEDIVVWHKEMPFKNFISLLIKSDICFDQVGSHWIGAGTYAMLLGKPLIANDTKCVEAGIWPEVNPVRRANTPETVCLMLQYLENKENRTRISKDSQKFVEDYMFPKKVVSDILKIL